MLFNSSISLSQEIVCVFLHIISTLWAAHFQSQFMDETQQGEMFYLKLFLY